MNKKRQDLIYIYDTDDHKIIMIDSETGERIEEKDDQVTSFLKYLHKENEPALLRKFAVWCTRRINADIKPIQKKILDLAENAIQFNTDAESLRQLYQKTEGTAIASDSVGLRHGKKSAAAYLAARECINPDVLQGSIQAARFHRLWAEMRQHQKNETQEDAILKEIKVQETENAVQKVERQQIDYLLDLMNENIS